MKNTIRIIVSLCLFLSFLGCATSWIGKNVSEVIAAKGEPTFTIDDGAGGKILFYSHYSTNTDPGGYSSTGPRGYYKDGKYIPLPQTYTRRNPSSTRALREWKFYVDGSGTIYDADYNYDTSTTYTNTAKPKSPPTGGTARGPIKDLFENSLKECTDSINKNPKDPILYLKRGNAYFWQDRYDEALADYNKAISLAPNKNGFIYYSRGSLYKELGKREEARRDFEKACELGDSDGCFYFNSENW